MDKNENCLLYKFKPLDYSKENIKGWGAGTPIGFYEKQNSIIRKMAEFISKFDIDETICKNVPTIESEECNKCDHNCKDCSELYEDNCPYEDCVDCIINYFENLE